MVEDWIILDGRELVVMFAPDILDQRQLHLSITRFISTSRPSGVNFGGGDGGRGIPQDPPLWQPRKK